MDDYISRQAVLEVLSSDKYDYVAIYNYVKKLPSVKLQSETGHWIDHHLPEVGKCMQYLSECSVCGKMICNRYNIYKNFCPCCGAKMEEEQKTT